MSALRMAYASSVPLNWIDGFVDLALVDYFYPHSEVCGEKPDCCKEDNPCEIKELCAYYRKHHS